MKISTSNSDWTPKDLSDFIIDGFNNGEYSKDNFDIFKDWIAQFDVQGSEEEWKEFKGYLSIFSIKKLGHAYV